ncbi:MAG: SRPBCC domain-containing protein [Phycisphaerales bacterium]|nr:SRPBCC domain-containing protein [Phycisphaerales bacterium]
MAFMALGVRVSAEPPAQPPARATDNQPPVGPGRTLTTEVIVDATPEEFWRLLSTPEGVIKLWSVARAEVDLRPGGTIRASYDADGQEPGWITHHILATEPARMVAFKTDAPPKAPDSIKLYCQHGWTVVRLEPAGPGRTRVVETMMGFGAGPLFDEAYAFFEKGNRWTADEMSKRLRRADAAPDQNDRAWSLLERMAAGGEWIHENRREDGAVFRVRSVVTPGPGGRSIAFRGWLGDGSGMFAHSSGLAWREASGEVWYTNLDEGGGRATGRILSPEENVLDWEWDVISARGASQRYAVRFTFDGPDAYRGVISSIAADGARKVMVDAGYRRVAESAVEFRMLRAGPASEGGAVEGAWMIDGGQFAATGAVEPGVVKEAIFDGAPEAAFRAFSSAEGWKAALGVESSIDLRVGGPFEIYFSMEAPAGERGAEGCKVLSYLPGRMFSFSWNAPPKFPKERYQRTWVVLTFAPAGEGKTAVRLEHTGFGSGGNWPEVRAYFDRAWGNVMEAFRSRAAASAVR